MKQARDSYVDENGVTWYKTSNGWRKQVRRNPIARELQQNLLFRTRTERLKTRYDRKQEKEVEHE